MAEKKTTVQITEDNIEQLNIKVGTILKDKDGIFWKITNFNDFTAGMKVCDKDGNELQNFVGNTKRSIFGGGLSDLLNDGVTNYFIEIEQQPEVEKDIGYNFFVKDTAEFEHFEQFEPIKNLTAEEAVKKFTELKEQGFSVGIGLNIPNDIVFDDPNGNGITILVIDENKSANFAIFGDNFIKALNIETQREVLKTRIAAYEDLYEEFVKQNIPCKYPQFVFDKKFSLELSDNSIKKNEGQITSVSLEEILDVMEMKPEVTPDGKIKLYDKQRQEYIDNRYTLSDSDENDWTFSDAAEIFERLDIYINDYYIHDIEEQLETGGVTLTGNETLKDLCDYAKEQLEAGITTVSQGELNLAMGIVHPDTVIMPEGFIEPEQTTTFTLQNVTAEQIKELKDHLSMNGYDVLWEDSENQNESKFNTNVDNENWISTILDERNISYTRSEEKTEQKTKPKELDKLAAEKELTNSGLNVKNYATNFVLEKLKSAGIEVVTDKEEFNRILEREKYLQMMSGTLTAEEQKRYFAFNDEEKELYKKQIDEWQADKSNIAKLITVGKIPPVMKVLGFPDNPIEIQHSTLSKAMRPIPQGYPNEAQGHALTIDDIYSIPEQLADPVMVFKSRTRDDSYVFFTERKDSQNRTILIPMAVNKHKGRIVINEITSMYGRNNETDFVKSNIEEDNLIYVDKKRSTEWERSRHVQFVTQRLSNSNANGLNILTKERLVNFISADSQERKSIQKMPATNKPEPTKEEKLSSFIIDTFTIADVGFAPADVKNWVHLLGSQTVRMFADDIKYMPMASSKDKVEWIENLVHNFAWSDMTLLPNLVSAVDKDAAENIRKSISEKGSVFKILRDRQLTSLMCKKKDEWIEWSRKQANDNLEQIPDGFTVEFDNLDGSFDYIGKASSRTNAEKIAENYDSERIRISPYFGKNPYEPDDVDKSIIQKMSLSSDRENVYGFAYDGKIYLNPDFLASNVAVHEYTHLWDEYTRRTNSELWQKGMNIFKDTKFFSEVKNDPNYADIANDDNLVLSEVHARICGKMAEKILERIAKEDGEITKDKAIDWNDEVFEYVYDEFGFGRNSAFAKEKMNGYVWSDYAQFLVTPLKDLMSGKDISLQQEKSTSENIEFEKHSILEECNKIIDKYTNTHFTEQEQKLVNKYENEESDRHQVLMSLCNMKYIHCTTKDKDGYWEINKGKEISANEARKLMSYDDFASGIDRASFHITAGRTANDGSFVYFNDSERKRDIKPYELSKENIELLSKYENLGGLKENIPKTVLEQLSNNNNELTAEDLKNAKILLPKEQYQVVLGYTQGEEGEHFKSILKEISSKAEAIKGKREILTEDEKHPLAFKYTLGNSRFYFSEWDGEDELFGYVVLNGDTQNSEWGYTSLEELKNAGGKDRNGFPVMAEMTFYGLEYTIEKQISVDYPELSEKMGFAPKLNHNEALISEFGKEIFETLQSRKVEQNAYNICCAAQFVIRTMDSSEQKEIFSIMKKCGCKGKNGKANTEYFLAEVVKAENNTASSIYDRQRLYEKINRSCSQKKPEATKDIRRQESDYEIEI